MPGGKNELALGEGRTLLLTMATPASMAQGSHMTPNRISATLGVVLLAAAAASACGGDTLNAATTTTTAATTTPPTTASPPTTAAAPVDDPDSPYCRNVIEWNVRQLTPYDPMDPEQLKGFISEEAAFHHKALELAPAELRADWQLTSDMFDNTVVRLLEKYGYSLQRVEAEATPEEHALADEPPPDVQMASARVHAYEARVCLSEPPGPADVTFDGPADADYCESTLAVDQMVDFSESAYSPETVEAVLTSQELVDLYVENVAAAPPAITDDVATITSFDREVKIPLIAQYGYDFRDLGLDATPAERAILNSSDPAVIDANRRVLAYEEQWCSE